MLLGRSTRQKQIVEFIETADPKGIWPHRSWQRGMQQICYDFLRLIAVVGGVIAWLYAAHRILFFNRWLLGIGLAVAGTFGLWWSIQFPEYGKEEETEIAVESG
jgi:hypothetical protein